MIASCVWAITDDLIVALDERFGEPVDAYVNGAQVWLRDDGPDDMTFEWRLHPVPNYVRPEELSTYEVFSATALALLTGGGATPAVSLWDCLEVFSAYGDEIEPAPLANAAIDALGIAPAASGLVDHDIIGAEWERTPGGISMHDALMNQLGV
jgi:hypothetical protein